MDGGKSDVKMFKRKQNPGLILILKTVGKFDCSLLLSYITMSHFSFVG